MNTNYIYRSKLNSNYDESPAGIVVLPDIYGQTDYAKATVEDFADTFKKPTFLFDYFYCLSKSPSVFGEEDRDSAHELMERMRGEDFVPAFSECLVEILADYPKIRNFIVVGFCFGGRLAYLSGIEPGVFKIVSFYGAGAHLPDYYNGETSIGALVKARKGDRQLSVLSFYGTQDPSISLEDQEKTEEELDRANIAYTHKEYDAGHAYFQPGRPNYNESAAKSSEQDLLKFINV